MLHNCLKNIVLFTFLTTVLYAQEKKIINFYPFPVNNTKQDIQEFIPLNSHIEDKLNIQINYLQLNNYQDIINFFKEGKIDIAYLDPLFFIALKKEYPYIQPIVSTKQNNNLAQYRCVLTKFKKDLIDKTKPIKVALTQPLSACGYYMSNQLLHDSLSLELRKQIFEYKISSSNAILSVLEGEYLLAGVQESIAKQYKTVGMEIIARSAPLPGFAFVVNLKTLSGQQIQNIQNSILNIKESTYKEWQNIFSNGFIKSEPQEYNMINVNFDNIPLQGNVQ